MKKIIAGAAVAAGLLAAGACGSKHAATPQDTAAEASAKAYVAKCVPSSALGQIELVKSLSSEPARVKLEACLGVPADQRQAFEAAALSAAEHTDLTSSTDRTQYLEVTLPGLAQQYRGKP